MQTVQLLREFGASQKLVRKFGASHKPFFLFSSFFQPHDPHIVPSPYDAMYDGVEIPLPKAVTLDETRKLPLPVQKQIGRHLPSELDRASLQWIYRSYYAAVSMVDHEVGLILDELEQRGKPRTPSLSSLQITAINWVSTGCRGRMYFSKPPFTCP